MDEEAWWLCVSVSVGLPLLYLIWKHHPSYGAHPGAPALPLLGCTPFILLNKHRLYEWTCELFDRSPSLTLRLIVGRSVFLTTADPLVVDHILKTNFACYPKGPGFYQHFAELFGNGIVNCDGPLWRFQRKVASPEFASNSLKDFVMLVADAEICGRVLPALSACCVRNELVNLQALFMHYTFDTICQLTFGADPACLCGSYDEGGANHIMPHDAAPATLYMKVPPELIQGFVQGFQEALQITAERFLVPDFVWKTKKFLRIGGEKKLLHAMEAVNKFADFVITQSKKDMANGRERRDLLGRFMQISKPQAQSFLGEQDKAPWTSSNDYEHGLTLSDSLLKDILLTFIFAGRETVASGATFCMWLLCVHARVKRAVLEEIKGILRARTLSGGHNNAAKVGTFSYEEIKDMNYLHAVLSESMRLYPPVPTDCKYAAQDDVLPDGSKVLKGYQVSYNVFAMGRAERIWGKECLEFLPERWLNEAGQFVPASTSKYPVFQAGPRICLGKDFAFIQMKLLVASLLRDFECAVQPGFKPKLSYGMTLTMLNGLPVTLKKREKPLC